MTIELDTINCMCVAAYTLSNVLTNQFVTLLDDHCGCKKCSV